MKLVNRTQNGLSHTFKGEFIFLKSGECKDIPKEVAKVWLNIKGVEKYVDSADLEKAEKEATKKVKELEAKIDELTKTSETKAKVQKVQLKGKVKNNERFIQNSDSSAI